MKVIPFVLGLGMMLVYYYQAIHFAKKILSKAPDKKLDCILGAVFNVIVYFALYLLGISLVQTLLFVAVLLFLEFKFISKSSMRQLVFGVSVFVFNITMVSVLTLIVFSHSLGIPVAALYQNKTLFFISEFIAYLILSLLLILMNKIVPMDKLKGMSSTQVYSEAVTITAALMTLYLWITIWVSFTDELYMLYLVSAVASAASMGVAFYCLFFFNVKLITLHSFKRKSDHVELMRKKNIEKQSMAEQKLYTDELTGVYNKRFIDKKLEGFCKQTEFDFAVIYGDLVALKHVNDSFGHNAGDDYIVSVAKALKNSVRNDDFVARIGGDEFLVLLYMITQEDVDIVVNRMKKMIDGEDAKADFNIYVNLGCVFIGSADTDREMLGIREKADKLMREDKRAYYEKGGGGK